MKCFLSFAKSRAFENSNFLEVVAFSKMRHFEWHYRPLCSASAKRETSSILLVMVVCHKCAFMFFLLCLSNHYKKVHQYLLLPRYISTLSPLFCGFFKEEKPQEDWRPRQYLLTTLILLYIMIKKTTNATVTKNKRYVS